MLKSATSSRAFPFQIEIENVDDCRAERKPQTAVLVACYISTGRTALVSAGIIGLDRPVYIKFLQVVGYAPHKTAAQRAVHHTVIV